jgi:hypothetical protein
MVIRLSRMITTHGECVQPLQSVKMVITVVLMVMNGMDPHMISGTRVGLVGLGLVSLVV